MKKFTETGLWAMLGNPKSVNNGFNADAVLDEFVVELQRYCREEKNIAERTRSLCLARNELGSHSEYLLNGSKKKCAFA